MSFELEGDAQCLSLQIMLNFDPLCTGYRSIAELELVEYAMGLESLEHHFTVTTFQLFDS